jgi:hypothetical protein
MFGTSESSHQPVLAHTAASRLLCGKKYDQMASASHYAFVQYPLWPPTVKKRKGDAVPSNTSSSSFSSYGSRSCLGVFNGCTPHKSSVLWWHQNQGGLPPTWLHCLCSQRRAAQNYFPCLYSHTSMRIHRQSRTSSFDPFRQCPSFQCRRVGPGRWT